MEAMGEGLYQTFENYRCEALVEALEMRRLALTMGRRSLLIQWPHRSLQEIYRRK